MTEVACVISAFYLEGNQIGYGADINSRGITDELEILSTGNWSCHLVFLVSC